MHPLAHMWKFKDNLKEYIVFHSEDEHWALRMNSGLAASTLARSAILLAQ